MGFLMIASSIVSSADLLILILFLYFGRNGFWFGVEVDELEVNTKY